jgi:hypothetical protein
MMVTGNPAGLRPVYASALTSTDRIVGLKNWQFVHLSGWFL